MPKDFVKRIHQALRAWHTRRAVDTLTDLLLAQQLEAAPVETTPRLMSNRILLAGLERLKQSNEAGADLLQRRFLDQEKASAVAYRRNLSEDIIFQQQRAAIDQLAQVIWQQELERRQWRARQIEARLDPHPYSQLFGVAETMAEVRAQLEMLSAPWLIALEGLGGIGKTTLAYALARDLALIGPFKDIAWVSARQQEFLPAVGLQPTSQPALDLDTLTNSLLEQFNADVPPSASPQAKMAALTKWLKSAPYLIIVDNLETVIDYEILLPTLRKWTNPSRFLLTSRHSLRAHADVYCCNLKELSQADTFSLLRHEAHVRGLLPLANASPVQLDSIYHVVGGNPLALKLVVGQIAIFPLPQVLENLKQARSKKIDELYTYIYWQAWNALDSISQQTLLAMPLAQDGDFAQLSAVTGLKVDALHDALECLVTLSLVEVGGLDLTERRYRIHRLTETFLLTEVTKWQSTN
jgi:DNA polymerase III delta prime subunit